MSHFGRRGLRRAITELHYRLRTEGDTPLRHAAAVGLGTLIGCVPLYGTHLLLCSVLARALGLNLVNTYLAAHINNPLTAPWLLWLSFGLGHRIRRGSWPPASFSQLRRLGAWSLGADLFMGSLLLGLLLGGVLGALALRASRRARRSAGFTQLIEETSRRYVDCGIFHWEFVRGKLRRDPLYRALVERLGPAPRGTLLDLGCGRGIALALVDTACPASLELVGVELQPGLAHVARSALGSRARIEIADLERFEPPPADLILLFDSLHYLDGAGQERLVGLAAAALRPGGRLLLREPDAALGARFWLTRLAERLCAFGRAEWSRRFRYRSQGEWEALLRRHGLLTRASPLWRGTPFANVLLEGTKPAVAP